MEHFLIYSHLLKLFEEDDNAETPIVNQNPPLFRNANISGDDDKSSGETSILSKSQDEKVILETFQIVAGGINQPDILFPSLVRITFSS